MFGKVKGTEGWADAVRASFFGHEGDYIFSKRGTDLEAAIRTYFGNTQILYDGDGEIVELVCYRPDHTMSLWTKGVWLEGRWLLNIAQDSTKVFHTFALGKGFYSWRHAFAGFMKPGDRWICPETENGLPIFPGSHKLQERGGCLYLEDTDIQPGAYFAMAEGVVEPPAYSGEILDPDSLIPPGEEDPDRALRGYFGNTFLFRKASGELVEVMHYAEDHTSRCWRDGSWCENGIFLLNNGQDSSMIIQTRDDIFDIPASWCHPFAPFKQPGDKWISPEDRHSGEASYPLTAVGIPVVTVNGEEVIVGTDMHPLEISEILRGNVPLEDLLGRKYW